MGAAHLLLAESALLVHCRQPGRLDCSVVEVFSNVNGSVVLCFVSAGTVGLCPAAHLPQELPAVGASLSLLVPGGAGAPRVWWVLQPGWGLWDEAQVGTALLRARQPRLCCVYTAGLRESCFRAGES